MEDSHLHCSTSTLFPFLDEISSFKACFLCSFPPLALLLSATGRSRIMFRKTFGTSMFSITAKRTVLVRCSHGSKRLICLTCSYIISIQLSTRAAGTIETPLSVCLSCHGSRFLLKVCICYACLIMSRPRQSKPHITFSSTHCTRILTIIRSSTLVYSNILDVA